MKVKLSIITINKDNRYGLELTAQSIVRQKNPGIEWIIVDGNSTDGSVDVIKAFESNINQWISEPDKGIYDAMNKGVHMSSGEYLIFMNSGDQFIDNILSGPLIQELSADIEYGDCMVVESSGLLVLAKQPSELSFQDVYARCICHQSCFIRRSIQIKYPYDTSLRLASCRKFFWDSIIFGQHSIKYHPEAIAIYDTTGVSTTQRAKLLNEVESILPAYIPPALIKDIHRLKEYDRIINNSNIFNILVSIHSFAGKKRIFEKIVTQLARLLFSETALAKGRDTI